MNIIDIHVYQASQRNAGNAVDSGYRPNSNAPGPPWYAGPTNRTGEAFSISARSPFRSTLSEPIIARVHSDESVILPLSQPPRFHLAFHRRMNGASTGVLSAAGRPSHTSWVLPMRIS